MIKARFLKGEEKALLWVLIKKYYNNRMRCTRVNYCRWYK